MNILNRIKNPDAKEPTPTKSGPNTLIKNAIKEADANDAGKSGTAAGTPDAGKGKAEETPSKSA